MRQFYLRFKKGDTLCHQLSWSHYRLLISIDDENANRIVNMIYEGVITRHAIIC